MSEFVEVMVDSVRVSLTSQQRIILLRCLDSDHYLPIWIGPYEAESITIALQEIELARPQTHDLLLQTLNQMKARLIKVEVSALKEDVFYANLVIEKDGETIKVDARPSDSIALAVRVHVPIFIAQEVIDTAGITPDHDLQQEPAEASTETDESPHEEETPATKKRLSVFEDFLENLDIGDESDKDTDQKSPDSDKPDKPDPA